jgi:hypothetical protein
MDKHTQIPPLSQTAVSGSVTASELRMGNLVYLPSKLAYAVDILYKNYTMLEHWRSIPITEEWLINFGFEKQTYSNLRMYYLRLNALSHGTITFYPKENGFNIDLGTINGYNFGTTEIKYVHQLQNLYFALTGSELQLVE